MNFCFASVGGGLHSGTDPICRRSADAEMGNIHSSLFVLVCQKNFHCQKPYVLLILAENMTVQFFLFVLSGLIERC